MAYKSRQRRNVQTAWRWDSTTLILIVLVVALMAIVAGLAIRGGSLPH